MSAVPSKEKIRFDSQAVIERCRRLVTDPLAKESDKLAAVQTAYEMGIAEGKLIGNIEMGERLPPNVGAA